MSTTSSIGVVLVGEGGGFDLPKGYIHLAMALPLGVETFDMRLHKRPASADPAKQA